MNKNEGRVFERKKSENFNKVGKKKKKMNEITCSATK